LDLRGGDRRLEKTALWISSSFVLVTRVIKSRRRMAWGNI
jgi:hypothetical protein